MRHLRDDTVLILDGEVRVYRRNRRNGKQDSADRLGRPHPKRTLQPTNCLRRKEH